MLYQKTSNNFYKFFIGYSENWYTICSACHTKYIQDREVDMDSEMVDQSESEMDIDQNDNDTENLLLYCHTMLSKNAKFLLHMVPASNKGESNYYFITKYKNNFQ